MNGWQRLGVVIGTLLAVPAGMTAYLDGKRAYVSHDLSPRVSALTGQEWTEAVYYEALQENEKLRGCILSTTTVTPDSFRGNQATIACERNPSTAFFDMIPWVVIPYLLVFGIGYTIYWIYRGFRPRQP
jgi:hypothetical protein